MIYFIQADIGGPIKIGYAGDVANRLRELQCGSPFPLVLLRVENGTLADEKRLHRHFAATRLHGEWFEPTPELRARISPQERLKPRIELAAPAPPTEAPFHGPLQEREQIVVDALHLHSWVTVRNLKSGIALTSPQIVGAVKWLYRRGWLERRQRAYRGYDQPWIEWRLKRCVRRHGIGYSKYLAMTEEAA